MTTAADILKQCDRDNVKFLRLMFTDILGMNKNVEVPRSQFEKALAGEIMFDGSSIEGFTRIEESDMLLKPDLRTFRTFPWDHKGGGKVARLICDIYNPDHTPFDGCPRLTLKRAVEKASSMGYKLVAGPEVEFFLFQRDDEGNPIVETHDAGGYFDLTPVDLGEEARREIVEDLEIMGFEVEAAHHEVAPGQHEIDFRYMDAVEAADNVMTFKFIVKKVALDYNLHASFMPKPIFGVNGSGMHTHQSLLDQEGNNTFYDPKTDDQLSAIAKGYIGGILTHVRSFVAVTNPLVNSFKRLVPGYEAPINVAWSEKNRSPLVRVPAKRGMSTRCEVRVPDPSCNPYLAFAVMLASGLDGIERNLDPGPPVNRNIFTMSEREKRRLKIRQLPPKLSDALDLLEKDPLMRETLGNHIFSHYIYTKRTEWASYISAVHPWEIDRYLVNY
ncbi:MAG TPA: glutamine synthetase family protein [Thermoanaerobaculia bacterium]|nr:glutamine synthetase family protein [Thermoanaerobaculia bacterium]HUM28759.1 glutamine synthetase family protein [Thermoanaerobaculia bacterium]HXK67991.1 glutamine synthetase family protein [Thermoanaerobaculia bacterium]